MATVQTTASAAQWLGQQRGLLEGRSLDTRHEEKQVLGITSCRAEFVPHGEIVSRERVWVAGPSQRLAQEDGSSTASLIPSWPGGPASALPLEAVAGTGRHWPCSSAQESRPAPQPAMPAKS